MAAQKSLQGVFPPCHCEKPSDYDAKRMQTQRDSSLTLGTAPTIPQRSPRTDKRALGMTKGEALAVTIELPNDRSYDFFFSSPFS
jgi:hypothetical protein